MPARARTSLLDPLRDVGGQLRWPLVSLFLVSMVSNMLLLTGPLYMLQIYDRVLASRSVSTLVALSLLVAGLYIFYALLEWIRSRMTVRIGVATDEAMSANLFRLSLRHHLHIAKAKGPDPLTDLDVVRQFVSGPAPLAFMDLPWLPVYLAVIFLLHTWLGWLALAGAIVISILMVINEVLSRRPMRAAAEVAARRQIRTNDAQTNTEAVTAMGMTSDVATHWNEENSELMGATRRAADQTGFYSSMTKGFRFMLQSAVLGLGAYLVILDQLTAGTMIAASILTSRALAPVEQVVGQWRAFLGFRQAFGRIRKALGDAPRTQRALDLPLPSKSLAAANFATGPNTEAPPLVADIKFGLSAGEAMGVLGMSGSGKSSLLRGLTGVWPRLHGEVRLDGSELSHFDHDRLGQAIGYLPQAVDLFDGTIADNIARFRPDASTEAILDAAMVSGAHELIKTMPDGYDTRLGPRGATLSAGQRQRIGLARALFGNPFVIALDEPNSNLDADGEEAVTEAILRAKARGAVLVVVAHRPSAIEAVDYILFLQNGLQRAFGPRDEILARITQQPATIGAEIEAEQDD